MSNETNGTGAVNPVAPQPEEAAPNSLMGVFGKVGRPMYCTFDLNTDEGRELLQKCEEATDRKVLEMANAEFNLAHFYGKVIDYTNPETHETYPLLRVCLVTDQGEVYGTCSDGVRDSLVRLCAGSRTPPFKKPIPVKVVLKSLGSNKQRLTLLEVFAKKGAKK